MAWVLLTFAGLFEIIWVFGLKHTQGFTLLWPSIFTLVTMGISFWLLSLAMKTLPMGTAYGVWVGIGAVGTVIVGILFLNESSTIWRLLSIALIISGVVGLKLS
ncbi:molecular chaperone [Thiopseudomonas alkaliphila]|uniref:Guanidinium exporter n=1 Tax=Thiopseudomonas alkaliphila TaxID=1697053 RepID=A0AAW7DPU4_9GAMM|nr:multidrug efflux SMR transporter [Thiopseudomonas alkaliphila]AKX44264.1 molecular chaperone [Thiopseudomonas alkaliphila]AKX54548.1 molecular chaperone [Thiopseudomonas alkaliphila]MDM1696127.1 multidrug efflux SMR transporter [Thiopseudomonas alkaliphila]